MHKKQGGKSHVFPAVLEKIEPLVFDNLLAIVGSGYKKTGAFFVGAEGRLDGWAYDYRNNCDMSFEDHVRAYDVLKKYIHKLRIMKGIRDAHFSGFMAVDTSVVAPGSAQKPNALPLHIEREDTLIGCNVLPTRIKNSALAEKLGQKHLDNIPFGSSAFKDDNLSGQDIKVLKNEPELNNADNSLVFLPGTTPHKARVNNTLASLQRVYFQIWVHSGEPAVTSPL